MSRANVFPTMKFRTPLILIALCVCAAAADDRREIDREPNAGRAAAVRVGDVPLVHTATMLPVPMGQQRPDADLGRQTDQLLNNLDHALGLGGSSLARIAKLNLSVRDPEMVAGVETALARRFAGKPTPAVTLVVGVQPRADILVSGDAVGTAPDRKLPPGARPVRLRSKNMPARAAETHAAILPPGPKVYLSGKTAAGSAAAGGRASLESLKEVMAHAQVRPEDVAQVKVMLSDPTEAAQLDAVLAEVFGPGDLPPVTLVDCRTPKPDVEIEMIAAGQPADAKRPVQLDFLTPPRWKPSPQFSQVVRVNRGALIYVSAFRGDPSTDPEQQALTIFARIKDAIEAAGGDMKHLAKAMYHITGREGAAGMDKVRPKVFDPAGPPAASRNTLRHMGGAGGAMVIDMIGVVPEK